MTGTWLSWLKSTLFTAALVFLRCYNCKMGLFSAVYFCVCSWAPHCFFSSSESVFPDRCFIWRQAGSCLLKPEAAGMVFGEAQCCYKARVRWTHELFQKRPVLRLMRFTQTSLNTSAVFVPVQKQTNTLGAKRPDSSVYITTALSTSLNNCECDSRVNQWLVTVVSLGPCEICFFPF